MKKHDYHQQYRIQQIETEMLDENCIRGGTTDLRLNRNFISMLEVLLVVRPYLSRSHL